MYFARISTCNNPANNLQAYLIRTVKEKFNCFLIGNREELYHSIEYYVSNAAFTYKRCTPVKARAHRDHQTKGITSITLDSFLQLSIHEVAGTIEVQALKPTPAPEPEPTPEPEADPAQPRQAICKSRDDDTPVELFCIDEFPPFIQRLLQTGNVWRIYKNNEQTLLEEYGGKTHLIIPPQSTV